MFGVDSPDDVVRKMINVNSNVKVGGRNQRLSPLGLGTHASVKETAISSTKFGSQSKPVFFQEGSMPDLVAPKSPKMLTRNLQSAKSRYTGKSRNVLHNNTEKLKASSTRTQAKLLESKNNFWKSNKFKNVENGESLL